VLSRHPPKKPHNRGFSFSRNYFYDNANRLTQINDQHRGTTTYFYNEQDYLTGVNAQSLSTDPAGNRLPEHSDLDQLLDNRLPFWGDRHYSYDSYGNITEIKRGQNQTLVQQLKYNAKHQLIELTETHHGQFKQKLIFQYDALGRRIWKKVYTQENAETEDYHHAEEYLWQGDRRVQTRYFNDHHWCINDEITIYQPGTHKPLAIIDHALGILDIETDHLGTPKALYDHETGREIWSTEHEVYGKTKNNASLKTHPKTGQAVDPKIRFQGQWEDLETGLYQNLHRFYDPHAGRYLNHDPIGLMGGLNAYQYCPNPVGWVDPLGLSCKEVSDTQLQIDRLKSQGHAIERHGGSVTNDDLITRARTGVAPDKSVSRRDGDIVTPNATAFNSYRLLVESDNYLRDDYLDRAISLATNQNTGKVPRTVTLQGVDVGSPVGRGYDSVGLTPNLQGPLNYSADLSKVNAVYKYNADENVWNTVTIYPVK
jgi:RHS repeat-associated protein